MPNETKKELGEANAITMDSCIRTIIAQMFEHDNDVSILEVVLDNTTLKDAPRVELQIKLLSINGKAPETEQAA